MVDSDERDFRLITEAYETLKDSNRRAAYDQELDEARQLEVSLRIRESDLSR